MKTSIVNNGQWAMGDGQGQGAMGKGLWGKGDALACQSHRPSPIAYRLSPIAHCIMDYPGGVVNPARFRNGQKPVKPSATALFIDIA
jgi:hypothetical protein